MLIILNEFSRKTNRFLAEDEENSLWVVNVCVRYFGMGGEEIHRLIAMYRHEVLKGIIVGDVEFIPIIKSCTPQSAIGNLKACRLNNMQSSAGNGTCARDVTCILRYLRVVKYDIYILHIRFLISFSDIFYHNVPYFTSLAVKYFIYLQISLYFFLLMCYTIIDMLYTKKGLVKMGFLNKLFPNYSERQIKRIIPVVDEIVVEVDVDNRLVRVSLPNGLLDLSRP